MLKLIVKEIRLASSTIDRGNFAILDLQNKICRRVCVGLDKQIVDKDSAEEWRG